MLAYFAGVGHAVFLQFVGELRVDPGRHELALAVRQRLFELALEVAVGNADLGHLVLVQELLELAVGYGGDLLCGDVKVLKDQEPNDRGDPIADVKTRLPAHIAHGVADRHN